MSVEISEQEADIAPNIVGDEEENGGNFVEEFMEKVSIRMIMSGSRSVGRNEARLMLAQFRNANIEFVTFDDPAVLMLDGVPVTELEEFLESGGAALEAAIRGPENEEEFVETGAAKPASSTLAQLRLILERFRKSSDIAEKDGLRTEFYYLYNALPPPSRQAIQPQIRSKIENALTLDAGRQEQLLMTLVLPTDAEEEKELVVRGGGGGGSINNNSLRPRVGSTGAEGYVTGHHGTLSAGSTLGVNFGELHNRATSTGSVSSLADVRATVVDLQRKSLTSWICNNLSSQHVWFFIAGFCLFWIFFLQTWVDYALGQIWRALLMEFLCLASLLICVMEADTQFIRMQVQERLYNYYQFLSTVHGRTYFYTFLSFLAFGQFSMYDFLAVFGGIILLLLTVTRFFLFQWSETVIDDLVILLSDSKLMRERFRQLDADNDGYLLLKNIEEMIDPNFAKCCCCRSWLKEIVFWRMDQKTNDGTIDIHEFVQFCLNFRQKQQISTERRDARKLLTHVISQGNKTP